ncbi:arsinothricin resistance N-acetyltransferase ArsN1 family B [Allosphingosinicella sp.]|uniref:arsinothricin resistance N-acetyltransferase ArsN1 family B n=1 Tax=Allosphingosinicella sp. TaxID=2823234 RepID=UPI002EF20844
MIVRLATSGDGAALSQIYAHYVRSTPISFESDPPDCAEMQGRIATCGELYPWLCAEEGGRIVGYAYAGALRERPAYRFAVETSVYVAADRAGRGVGRALYSRLLDVLVAQGFAQAIGAITLPNEASVRLHEALGFVAAGTYRQVGWKLGAWHDVGLWQRGLAPTTPPAEPSPFAGVWS